MPDPITMTGQYAFACDPYTQVRILCVDRPGGDYPIVTMDKAGTLRAHNADGRTVFSKHEYTLVPLKVRRKPVEAWAVVTDRGDIYLWRDDGMTDCAPAANAYGPGARLVHLVEAEDGK